jgi:UDP-N-acetylmuramate dehydrogenase
LSSFSHNISLQQLNTFNVKASAEHFVQIDSVEQLLDLSSEISTYSNRFILGGGSNLLFVGDYQGLVIYPQLFGIKVIEESDKNVRLRVAASENWHEFVKFCLTNGYFGVENLALIPGTVGAAPVQNIGAYGVEIEKFIQSIECYDVEKGQLLNLTHRDCQFGYRDSYIKRAGQGRFLVTSVELLLPKLFTPELSYKPLCTAFENLEATPQALFDEVCRLRQSKLPDPTQLANAGSFFKNPVVSVEQYQHLKQDYPELVAFPVEQEGIKMYKIAAGWLIEKAGFKGKQFGGVGVHKHQALVLVNYSESSGLRVWELAETIMQQVQKMYDISLEPEVRILGQ